MSTIETASVSLNPEGESIRLDAAEHMVEELLQACDGRHTDVSGAQELLKDAEDMLSTLGAVETAGIEVSDMINKLNFAMDHLRTAVKQVH